MESVRDLASRFVERVADRDAVSLEQILSPEFQFQNPLSRASRKEFLSGLAAPHLPELELKSLLVDGNQACAIYVSPHVAGETVTEIIEVRDGKVCSSKQSFDATRLHRRSIEI